MHRIVAGFNNLSLYKKIILIVSVFFFCIYAAFLFSLSKLTDQYDKTLYETNAALLNQITGSIESEMSAIETITNNILVDETVQEKLCYMYHHPELEEFYLPIYRRDAYNAAVPYTYDNPYIRSVFLLLADGNMICIGFPSDLQYIDLDRTEAQIDAAGGRPVWFSGVHPGNVISCGRTFRQMKDVTMEKLGSLYITVDLSRIISDTLKKTGYAAEDADLVLMDQGNRIYPSSEYQDGLCRSLISDGLLTDDLYSIQKINGRDHFIIGNTLTRSKWNCLYFRDYDSVFYHVKAAKYAAMLMTLCFGIVAFFLIHLAMKHMLRHMDFLLQKIRSFGSGEPVPKDITSYHYEDRQDEIGQLHHSFDEMTHSVKVLRDENYDKQLLLQDATIKMLQQQINPHFLYNTLDTINWLAMKYGAEDISTIALSLGNLFRSTISGSRDLIPLSEELSILENYIQIQRIRFKDRLNFRMVIPDDLSHIYVPKLCIQPLVENALKYAMEFSDEPCTIRVLIQELEQEYRIEVSNTGSQFEENLLEKIQNKEITPQGSGVGMINIDSRLKLLYGTSYGLHLYNQDGKAVVRLTIPKETEVTYVKTHDR